MKKLILPLLGCSPLLLGYLQNYLMMSSIMPPLLITSLAVLAVWFCFGMFSVKLAGGKAEAVLLLNAPAFVVLLLVLFQEFVLGRYWPNHLGVATQFFWLPILNIAGAALSAAAGILGSFIRPMTVRNSYAVITAFIFFLAASYCGRLVGERRG